MNGNEIEPAVDYYHWLGCQAQDAADRERERQQAAIDAQRIAEFELRHLPEVIDE